MSSKKIGVRYIDRYIQKKASKKVLLKHMLYFEIYKKEKFLIVKGIKIVVRWYIFLLEIWV
jgi:hypothetical protein